VKARRFTGERLHAGHGLFAVDLARHRAAYAYARAQIRGGRVLDLGSGSGHGTAQLGGAGASVVGADRVAPDAASRSAGEGTCFARADLRSLPFRDATFDLIVSFQVIEHLEDPSGYLDAIARLLEPEGLAILTTPNLRTSHGVNPYHVQEYLADEFAARLKLHFEDVEMRGVGMAEAARAHMARRARRIRRILRLDPLHLRDRLSPRLSQLLFSWFAILVRFGTRSNAASPAADWRQFPIGPASEDCLDLLALCRRPR
jgi:SAM-dependent methyltransferase